MWNRIVNVFRLDPVTFEAIEHDHQATGQAALVVIMVALLVGLGNGFTSIFGTGVFFRNFVGTIVWSLIGWVIWSAIVYIIGTALFHGVADLGEMLRVVGFAMAPLALGIIPCLGGLVGSLWAMAAAFVAVRQGLDLDNLRALLTVVIGFIVYALGYAVLLFALGR